MVFKKKSKDAVVSMTKTSSKFSSQLRDIRMNFNWKPK